MKPSSDPISNGYSYEYSEIQKDRDYWKKTAERRLRRMQDRNSTIKLLEKWIKEKNEQIIELRRAENA